MQILNFLNSNSYIIGKRKLYKNYILIFMYQICYNIILYIKDFLHYFLKFIFISFLNLYICAILFLKYINLWLKIGYITGFTSGINNLDLHIKFLRDASNFSIEKITGLRKLLEIVYHHFGYDIIKHEIVNRQRSLTKFMIALICLIYVPFCHCFAIIHCIQYDKEYDYRRDRINRSK